MNNAIKCFMLIFILSFAISSSGCGQKKQDHAHSEPQVPRVHLKPEVQKSTGLKTVLAEKTKLILPIEVFGSISQDTENTAHLIPDKDGVLNTFKVQEGDTVETGQVIATIEGKDGKEFEVLSPTHGIVIARYVKPGDRVDILNSMATLANPDLLRASFDIYEKDISWIQMGQHVLVKSSAYPDREFEGKVVFISPRVDETTRTVKIRVDVENPEHELKFGMFVTGHIQVESDEEAVIIPLESIQVLEHDPVVFIKDSENSFEIRPVILGRQSGSNAEILKGLAGGETLVTSGSFVLKSEALKEELEEGGHDH